MLGRRQPAQRDASEPPDLTDLRGFAQARRGGKRLYEVLEAWHQMARTDYDRGVPSQSIRRIHGYKVRYSADAGGYLILAPDDSAADRLFDMVDAAEETLEYWSKNDWGYKRDRRTVTLT